MNLTRTEFLLVIFIPLLTQALDENEISKIENEIKKLKPEVLYVHELEEHTAPGPKSGGLYAKKYVAVCELSGSNYVFGAFATLDGFDPTGTKDANALQQFLCLGFGQLSKNFGLTVMAKKAYFAHPDAFGIVVSLPALFSGKEEIAKSFFLQNDIQDKIKEQLRCRRDEKKQTNVVKLEVVRTWVIPVGKETLADEDRPEAIVGILKISVGSEITFRFCIIRLFSNIDNENFIFELGTPQVDETKAILTLVDYVQRTHLTDMTAQPTSPVDLSNHLDALTYTIDFVFRKLSGVDRGDLDKTPAANKALISARFLLGMSTKIDFCTLIALLLKDVTQYSDTTITEIKKHFGEEVAYIVGEYLTHLSRSSAPVVLDLTEKQKAYFQNFETVGTSTELQENDTLLNLLKRRYTAYFKEKAQSDKMIHVKFFDGFRIEDTSFAIFSAHRVGDEQAFRFVMRGQTNTNSKSAVSQVVVEELLTSDRLTIKKFIVEDCSEALLFLKLEKIEFPNLFTKGLLRKILKLFGNNPVTEDDRKLIQAEDFAARKHAGEVQRRKGGFKSAYMNHVQGVLRALVWEGRICVNNLAVRSYTEQIEKEFSIVLPLIVALLHDTLENTSATKEELTIVFGEEVAFWVGEVTDPKHLTTSDAKKANQEEKALTQSPIASLIKMADRINNLRDWLLLLPDALPWPKIPFYVASTQILVENYKKNVENNSAKWHPWETTVYNNLKVLLDNLLEHHKNSCRPQIHCLYLL